MSFNMVVHHAVVETKPSAIISELQALNLPVVRAGLEAGPGRIDCCPPSCQIPIGAPFGYNSEFHTICIMGI